MSDASEREHLAPVSYLPWATPGVTGDAAETDRPVGSAEVRSDAGARRRGGEPASGSRSGRRAAGAGASGRPGRGGTGRGTALEAVDPDETGAERDERIDRLVVGRLRRSSLSVAEVRAVLVEHGLDDGEVDEWLERYERLGYLDDARLAEQLVHSHGERRGRGSGAVLAELSRRGIDAGVARQAVGELDPEIELDNAIAVAERRARQLRGLERQVAERRLSAFLARRGYPGDVVREAVTAALSGERS
ncbi:regulatory protein RecX [Agromyces soli]